MAFTGTATVVQVADNLVRITGLSLANAASGTIGLAGHTGAAVGVALPAAFKPSPYEYGDAVVALSDMLEVTVQWNTSVADSIPPAIVKTGTTDADWRCTITNPFASVSPGMEIYVRLH